MDVKSLKGIAVVTIEGGEKVGAVDDMLFNLEQRRLVAFRMGRSSFFRGERHYVDMSEVESVGTDAIMIRDRSRVHDERDNREYSELPNLGAVTSLRVVTENGGYIGTLGNVHIDPGTGALSQLDVSSGTLASMLGRTLQVPATDIVSLGTDVAVIPNTYGPHEEPEDADQDTATQ